LKEKNAISSCRISTQPTKFSLVFLEMRLMGYLANCLEIAAWKLAAHCRVVAAVIKTPLCCHELLLQSSPPLAKLSKWLGRGEKGGVLIFFNLKKKKKPISPKFA
jgi:hypothetical protein